MKTLLREYYRAAVKLSSIDRSAVTKGLGTTGFTYKVPRSYLEQNVLQLNHIETVK